MNLSIIFYVIILFVHISKCKVQYSSVLEIEQGLLRGILRKDIKGGNFYSFLRIPYARKPIGNLRFMVPESADKWDDILNATEDMPMCTQQDWSGNIIGQEDCLYLNIHTPEFAARNSKPVMVFIHGGGFMGGDGRQEMYGPEFLMPEGVVLVTMNYRLGLLGFLNFENARVGVSGNMGLKDQNMALRWVQNNIKKFGGDPNCVTIFGQSAGGASVHFHLLSPMSQGLFHRVIAQSGTALNTWATIGRRNSGVHAAKFLGYKDTQELGMLAFLQKASVEDVIKVQENATMMVSISEPYVAGPIVENIKGCMSFLPENTTTMVSSKKFKTVPLMLGFTNNEGIAYDVASLLKNEELQDLPPEETILYSFNVTNSDIKGVISNKIQSFYYENNHSEKLGRFKLFGDAWFYWEILKSAKAHAKIQVEDLYLYKFSADTELNYFKGLFPATDKIEGASHVDDLGYIFKTIYTTNLKQKSPEWNAMQRVVKLWTNFAKYGNPTPKFEEFHVTWRPVGDHTLNYMNIDTNDLAMKINPFHRRMIFWDKLEEYVKGTRGKGDVHCDM